MDPFFILAVIISTTIFIIVPLLFIRLIFLLLKKSVSKKVAIIISSAFLTIFCYFVFINFFPRESFYVNNFEENTEIALPEFKLHFNNSGNNSFYSFGDYNISYSYEFTTKDYNDLYSNLIIKGFQETGMYMETNENDKILENNTSLKINKILTKDFGFKNFDILFMDDNKTIIFNSNKW